MRGEETRQTDRPADRQNRYIQLIERLIGYIYIYSGKTLNLLDADSLAASPESPSGSWGMLKEPEDSWLQRSASRWKKDIGIPMHSPQAVEQFEPFGIPFGHGGVCDFAEPRSCRLWSSSEKSFLQSLTVMPVNARSGIWQRWIWCPYAMTFAWFRTWHHDMKFIECTWWPSAWISTPLHHWPHRWHQICPMSQCSPFLPEVRQCATKIYQNQTFLTSTEHWICQS